jgi:hypothetical protein
MNLAKLATYVFIGTAACFLLSFASAEIGHLNGERSFPRSLEKAYARASRQSEPVTINKTISAANVAEVEVRTTNTDVDLEESVEDQIAIELKGEYPKPDSLLKITGEGGKVIITVENHENDHSFFNFEFDSGEGHMRVKVPKSIHAVALKTVSGDVEIEAMNLERLNVESVSGDLSIGSTDIANMKIKTVSGDIEADGKIKTFTGHSISGDLHLELENNSPTGEFKSTSGDLDLNFKDKPDMQVQFATISGDLTVAPDFGGGEVSGGRKVSLSLGSGLGQLSAKTISGDVRLGKIQ